MITLDLVEYIEKEEKNGASRDKIKSDLLSAGWLAEDIEEGFQKVAPAFVVPKSINPIAPKIATTISPSIESSVPEQVKQITPEINQDLKILEKTTDSSVLSTQEVGSPEIKLDITPEVKINIKPEIKPDISPAIEVEATSVSPKQEIVSEVKPEVKVTAPKIDPYREPIKEDKPIENRFSASTPPSNLPKVWEPANIPVISNENVDMIPRLIPKKVEVKVPPKAVLPPVNTPERKAELAKVYVKPIVQDQAPAPMSSVLPNTNLKAPAMGVPPVIPVSKEPVASVESPAPLVFQSKSTPEAGPVASPVSSPLQASVAPAQKPPYMVFAKPNTTQSPTIPSSTPYSPNSAVTSSFTRDAKNFVIEEKKPGVPRFIVWVFVFLVLICIFGGLAFAYMTGLVTIPFLPKIDQTAVTAKYVNPMVEKQNITTPDVATDINIVDVSNMNSVPSDNTDVVLNSSMTTPSVEVVNKSDLILKDKKVESILSDIELQIYKKYAINKNQYGLKPNTKGSCDMPEKDSLFYTDPKDTNTVTISTLLASVLENTSLQGSCFSTTKAWAMSFPLLSEEGSHICVDSTNKKIITKIALTGTVCK